MDLSIPPGEKPSKRWFSDWQFEHYDKEMLMGVLMASQQRSPTPDLLQNCDLPPPVKLFSPLDVRLDEKTIIPMRCLSPPTPKQTKVNRWEDELGLDHRMNHGGEISSLLRALQLSQTRAREAEKKASLVNSQTEKMSAMILDGSMRLYAHRQWVKLLEIEISLLQKRLVQDRGELRDEMETTAAGWCWALALCLGIAGVGFVLSHYMF